MFWADADIGAAAEALRHLRENPELAERLGRAGASFAVKEWSAGAYSTRVLSHLGFTGAEAFSP